MTETCSRGQACRGGDGGHRRPLGVGILLAIAALLWLEPVCFQGARGAQAATAEGAERAAPGSPSTPPVARDRPFTLRDEERLRELIRAQPSRRSSEREELVRTALSKGLVIAIKVLLGCLGVGAVARSARRWTRSDRRDRPTVRGSHRQRGGAQP